LRSFVPVSGMPCAKSEKVPLPRRRLPRRPKTLGKVWQLNHVSPASVGSYGVGKSLVAHG
jgi:hypothetical protein